MLYEVITAALDQQRNQADHDERRRKHDRDGFSTDKVDIDVGFYKLHGGLLKCSAV